MVQLGIWTASGAFFAIVPIKNVRGTSVPRAHERPLAEGVSTSTGTLGVAEVLARAGRAGVEGITGLELRATASGLYWFAATPKGRIRLTTGEGLPAPIERAEAEAIARRDQPGAPAVVAVERVERDAPIEYRDKPLPAWRVQVQGADQGMNLWIDANSGEVTARRSDLWRAYDLLWSLHIMDYSGRDNFNHPLIVGAALLGLATVLSGVVLWALRLVRR